MPDMPSPMAPNQPKTSNEPSIKPMAPVSNMPTVSTAITFMPHIAVTRTTIYGNTFIIDTSPVLCGDSIPLPMKVYMASITTATGITRNEFTRNLSLCLHPCVEVAAMVVSEMNERLSPNSEPPTMTAVSKGTLAPVEWATPAAIGVSATMVPTLVPMDTDTKHAARNNPASSILPGRMESVRLTVASMLPITLAVLAKAPASTNIHSISIILPIEAPRLNIVMRSAIGMPPLVGMPPHTMTAYIDDSMNATVIGTL